MNRLFAELILLAGVLVPAAAQPAITYDVSWESAEDHYYGVSMDIGRLSGPTVDVSMPAWRPGRYVLQNYVKYVIDFAAQGPDGSSLPFTKLDKDTLRVETLGNARVVVRYKNYANVLDAGESYLDASEAYLNPISVLMNVPDRMSEPVGLKIQRPEGWRVATALEYDDTAAAYVASDYHELVDSPFLVSPSFDLISFDVNGTAVEIAVQGEWDYDEARLIADHRAILGTQSDIMGIVPFERYLFMYHILDRPGGHGVEHKNSTSIVLGPGAAINVPEPGQAVDGFYGIFLRVASHELFHAWNVERIRPAAMYPTDYSTEQYTTQMWIFEGITDYYADVALRRAGLLSEEAFLGGLASTVGSFDKDPGRRVTSIAMSSFDSWTKQDNAPPNTFYSFYTAGKSMGLVLDLEVRGRTGGAKSLDDVFRYLYTEYPMKDRGLPEGGFQQALEVVTGSSFDTFFDHHIFGTEEVDWNAHLSWAGLSLTERRGTDPTTWLRVFLVGTSIMDVDPEGLAGRAGLLGGDEIKRIGGYDVTDRESLSAAFANYSPGERVEVIVNREGAEHAVEVEVGTSSIEVALTVSEDSSAAQTTIRRGWLGER
jgi:predicted metalloprotease with PDZ domain